jgi:hypothetical protein
MQSLAPGLHGETSPEREPIGLLVVHGIGRQTKGATAAGIVEGLQTAYPRDLRVSWASVDHALVEGLGPPVHVIEVFWADVFRDEDVRGTFDMDRIFELIWFPRLNWECGLLTGEIVARSRVRLWTAVLAVLSPFLWCALVGAGLLASIPEGVREARAGPERRRDREPFREQVSRRFRNERGRGAGERTLVDDLMDTVVGDVFNYVDGFARAFPDETTQTERLIESVDEIQLRFEEAARRAVELGCREIQVVAHSLGSVIAFLSMLSSQDEPPRDGRTARLTRVYTIGSPLMKVRFFWPRLFERPARGPAIAADRRLLAAADNPGQAGAMCWDNFYNKLDLVSGSLPLFPGWPKPTNHPVPALGGVLTAHVAYHANPSFLASLGNGLKRPTEQTKSPRWLRLVHAVLATLQPIAAPLLFLLLVLIGLAAILGLAWGTGWVVAKPFDLLGLHGVATGIRFYMVGALAFAVFVASSLSGRSRAKEKHASFWAAHARQQPADRAAGSAALESRREG